MREAEVAARVAEPVFAARGLVKRHRMGEVVINALRGVDLTIRAGEIVAVAGPSGCGKTTLLNILGLLDVPDEGALSFCGRDVTRASSPERTKLRRHHLGFVFQTFNLIPTLSAFENVEYPLFLTGTPAGERRRRTDDILERVGMAHRARHRPDRLSGGERQRIAVARALVHGPDAVLADEPTANLDSETGTSVLSLLRALNVDRGTTIVLATHDPAVLTGASRIVRVRDGSVEPVSEVAP